MGCNSSTPSKVSDVAANVKPPVVQDIEKSKPSPNTLQVPEVRPAPRTPSPVAIPDEPSINTTRLLLLGSAESGKTTLLQQVRLLYKQHFGEAEIFHRRAFIYNNIFRSIKALVQAMRDQTLDYADPINAGRAQSIIDDEDSHYGLFSNETMEKIKHIWKDGAIQKLYARRSMFNLNDSTAYFLNNIEKINKTDYKPSEKDLIMSYVPTVGVQNVIFTVNNQSYQLFDIGGQKIDRRKWATQYDGIDAIFFCLAISEYDQLMNEDLETNRLDDALLLLRKISEEPKFKQTMIYLFLNEIDVFEEKLKEFPLENYKTSFGGGSSEDALEFIEDLAIKSFEGREKTLYRVYRSVAIDTKSMSDILGNAFKDISKKKKG